MMKMKKTLVLILAALVALLAFCACGGEDGESASAPDSAGSVYDSYASSSDDARASDGEPDGGESSGSSLNENYFQSSVTL